jgi:hypothetical protein
MDDIGNNLATHVLADRGFFLRIIALIFETLQDFMFNNFTKELWLAISLRIYEVIQFIFSTSYFSSFLNVFIFRYIFTFYDKIKTILVDLYFLFKFCFPIFTSFLFEYVIPLTKRIWHRIFLYEFFLNFKLFCKNVLFIIFVPNIAYKTRLFKKEKKTGITEGIFNEVAFKNYIKVNKIHLIKDNGEWKLPSKILILSQTFKYRYKKIGKNHTKVYYNCIFNRDCSKNSFLLINNNIESNDEIVVFISKNAHDHF